MTKIGINGFGRIGRNVFRAAMNYPSLQIVAVNDLSDAGTLAHLLTYDTVHGKLDAEVQVTDSGFSVNGKEIKVFQQPDPLDIPWEEWGVEIVIESTGRFTQRDEVEKHRQAGAKKVIISAPAGEVDATLVMGVNQDQYQPEEHHIVSNASCTTNALAPVVKVLHDQFGIESGLMTTVHAFTNDQKILDLPHRDLRRARAASESIIPTTTGAAKAVSLVLPELEGRLNGMAIRVPVKNVSLIDLVVNLERRGSKEQVNQAFREAENGSMREILGFTEEPLVSIDYNGNPRSSIIDGLSTMELGENMIKVIAWYDNEWAYSNRIIDLAQYIQEKGIPSNG